MPIFGCFCDKSQRCSGLLCIHSHSLCPSLWGVGYQWCNAFRSHGQYPSDNSHVPLRVVVTVRPVSGPHACSACESDNVQFLYGYVSPFRPLMFGGLISRSVRSRYILLTKQTYL